MGILVALPISHSASGTCNNDGVCDTNSGEDASCADCASGGGTPPGQTTYNTITLSTGSMSATCPQTITITDKTLPTTQCTQSVILSSIGVDDDGTISVNGNQVWNEDTCDCNCGSQGTKGRCARNAYAYTDVTRYIKRDGPTPVTLTFREKCSSGAGALSATFTITELVPQAGEYCENGQIKKGCPGVTCNVPAGTCILDGKKLRTFTSAPDATCACKSTAQEIDCGNKITRCDTTDTKKILIIERPLCSTGTEGTAECSAITATRTCTRGCVIDSATKTAVCTGSNGGANKPPVLSALSVSKTIVAENTPFKITGTTSDENGDDIELRCSESEGTKDSFQPMPCEQPKTDKTKPECNIIAHGSGSMKLYCRAFDGEEYSEARSVQLTIDNNPPISVFDGPLENTVQTGDFDVNVIDTDTIGDANAPNNIAKGYYRTTSKNADSTFLLKRTEKLTITANNRNIIILNNPQDITYKFEITGASPSTQVDVYYSMDSISGSTAGTGARQIPTSCDGGSFSTIANSRGIRIAQFLTDSQGKGSKEITTCATPDAAAAYLFDAYSGSTKIASNVFKIQTDAQEEPFLWATRTVSTSGTSMFKVTTAQCPDQGTDPAVDGPCNVWVKATDKAGNEGEAVSRPFRIAQVSSKITAPNAGQNFGTNFKVKVDDRDLSGTGLKTCYYKVVSNNMRTIPASGDWRERPCNTEQEIPVKTEGCKDTGTNICEILVRAENNNGVLGNIDSVKVSIDFNRPSTVIHGQTSNWVSRDFKIYFEDSPADGTLTCEYKVVSGTATTVDWKTRPCSSSSGGYDAEATITVGPSGNCRNEGAKACTIFARSSKGGLRSDEAKESYNILLTQVLNEDGLTITPSDTATGLRFTALPKETLTLPIFRICNSGSSIADCRNAFKEGINNCGLNKPCLCGSLNSYRCDVTCSENDLTYYGLATGTGGATIISKVQAAKCPKTALGDMEELIERFKWLDGFVTGRLNEARAHCPDPSSDPTNEFCQKLPAIGEAQRLVLDHLDYLNGVKANPTSANAAAATARSKEVWDHVFELLGGGKATEVEMQMTIPPNGRIGNKITMPASVAKKAGGGNTPYYAKVDCTITPPKITTASPVLQKTSACTLVPFPYNAEFTPDQPEKWSVLCKLLTSLNSACSRTFEETSQRKSESIDVVKTIKSMITNIDAPVTAVKSSTVQIKVTARNPDRSDTWARTSCRVQAEGSAATTEQSLCKLINAEQEQVLDINFLASKVGRWTIDNCRLIAASDNGCTKNVELHDSKPDVKILDVREPTTMIIEKIELPKDPPVDRETTAIATIYNPPNLEDSYARVICAATTTGGPQSFESACEFIKKGNTENMLIKFTPHVLGKWDVSSCTLAVSNGLCDNNRNAHTLPNAGSFNVVAGRQLLIDDVTVPPSVKLGDEIAITVKARNPTINTRFGKATCTFIKPENGGKETKSSDLCVQIGAGQTKFIDVKIKPAIPKDWIVESCQIESGTSDTQCTSSSPDDKRISGKHFIVTTEAAGAITLEDATPPANPVIYVESTTSVSIKNTGSASKGTVTCKFNKGTNTKQSSSSCTDVAGGTAQAPGSTQAQLRTTFDATGTWTLNECSIAFSGSCGGTAQPITKQFTNKNFDVTDPRTSVITSVQMPTNPLVFRKATLKANVYKPINEPLSNVRVTCYALATGGGVKTIGPSTCVPMDPGSQKTIDLDFTPDVSGTWIVGNCEVSISQMACDQNTQLPVTSRIGGNGQIVGTFDVKTGDKLIIEAAIPGGNKKVGQDATAVVSVRNPTTLTRFGSVTCDFIKPSGTSTIRQTTAASPCSRFDPSPSASQVQNFLLKTPADIDGLWKLDTCTVKGTFTVPNLAQPDCSAATADYTFDVKKDFTVAPVGKLAFGEFQLADIQVGQTGQVKAGVANGDDALFYGQMECTFRNTTNNAVKNSSACTAINGNANANVQLVASIFGKYPTTWSVEQCTLSASRTPGTCANPSLHDTQINVGTIKVATEAAGAITLEDATPPANPVIYIESTTSVSLKNTGSASKGTVTCKFSKGTNTKQSSSACTDLAGGTLQAAGSTQALVKTTFDETGTWTLNECTLAFSTSCGGTTQPITKQFINKNFNVIDPTTSVITSVQMPTNPVPLVYRKATLKANIYKPMNEPLSNVRVTCYAFVSGQAKGIGPSNCAPVESGSQKTIDVDFTPDASGTWTVTRCDLATSALACDQNTPIPVTSSIGSSSQPVGTFDVKTGDKFIISQVTPPGNLKVGQDAVATVQARNPTTITRFGSVTCDFIKPGTTTKQTTQASACLRFDPSPASSQAQNVAVKVTADIDGLWKLDTCTVKGTFTVPNLAQPDCSAATADYTFDVKKDFTVAPVGKLAFGEFQMGDVQVGETGQVKAGVMNGDDALFYGQMECTFRNTTNNVVKNSSACTAINGNANAQLTASIFGKFPTTWSVERCTLSASRTPGTCANPSVHDTQDKIGSIKVTAEPLPTITAVQPPVTVALGAEGVTSIVTENKGSNKYGTASCKFRDPNGQLSSQSSSSCALLAGNSQSTTLEVRKIFSVTGQWTLISCSLNSSTSASCATNVTVDEEQAGKTIDVTKPNYMFIANKELPTTVIKGNVAQINLTVENPLGDNRFALVSCTLSTPGGQRPVSNCTGVPAGTQRKSGLNIATDSFGTWTLSQCSVKASFNAQCGAAQDQEQRSNLGSFEVVRGTKLTASNFVMPPDTDAGTQAIVAASISNPSQTDLYGFMSCTFRTPLNSAPVNSSGCVLVPGEQSASARIFITPNAAGTWTVESCTVKGSFNADCSDNQTHFTKQNIGEFKAKPPPACSASVKCPGTDAACFCPGSECKACGAGEKCVNNICVTPQECIRDEDCKTGFICQSNKCVPAPAVQKDLRILSARTLGNVFRGEFARVEIVANGTEVDDKYAAATCTFRTQSGQSKTNNSQCAQIQARTQKTLTAQIRADELGTWNVTSCVLRASANQDCSPAAANDTRNNIGTFDVSAASNLIVAQIIPKDTLNGTTEDITVKVDNPLTDSRFGRVTCDIKKPSGALISRISSCARADAGATKDFLVSDIANEIGTWNVTRCSVFESLRSDCSSGSTVHSANGTTFIVSRADKITFTSGLIFPDSLQNGSMITIRSSARNPSAADTFAKMRCIFVLPQGTQTMLANSSCFVMPGETALPVSVSMLVNKVGLWQIASCSMMGASDAACSDEAAQATNSTGGQFVSVGAQVNNLSILGKSATLTAISGDTAEIKLTLGNDNDFLQYTNMTCALRNPAGQEENITSQCNQIAARATLELNVTKAVNDIGIWNVSSCKVVASTSAACAGAVLQNTSDNVGLINVTNPTGLIITSVSGNGGALNASLANVTVTAKNPLSQRKFALLGCDIRSPSGRNFTNSTCTGLNANDMRAINLSFFVDEVGTWSIPRCSINASSSFDCSNSQLNNNVTDGTFNVARRINLTFVSAGTTAQRVFNGTPVTVTTSIRNPSETDLFGIVTCSFKIGTATRQNSSACTLFRGGTATPQSVSIVGDLLGTWNGDICTVTGTLNANCGQADRHDTTSIAGSVNVTTVPDIAITGLDVPEGINRNTTGNAGVTVLNNGTTLFATATCNIRSPVNIFTNSSGCQRIDPGSATIVVPFFVDRMGNWSVFGCSVNGSTNNTCGQPRLHNVSNITRNFNGTGRTLQIVDPVLKPEDGLQVGDRAEILVTIKNIDSELHRGFVNCTLRQPNNVTKEITSAAVTIPVDDTRLFKPVFTAELSGTWRLRSCAVFKTDAPASKEEKTIDEIFLVGGGIRPPPGGVCSLNQDCPGTDARCYCSGQSCRACPTGTTCRNYVCENIIPPQCTFDSDCPVGYRCDRATCIAGGGTQCTFDTDCAVGQQCDNGVCNPKAAQCTYDEQCLPTYKCINKKCEKEQPSAEGQPIIALIIIVIVALAVAILLFAFIRRRISKNDIFSEVEGKNKKEEK